MRIVVFVLLGCLMAHGLYTIEDDVVILDGEGMEEVASGNDVWLVEFYAPWCGHCKNLAPAWKEAATALKGVAKVGALDMDAHREAGAPYDVTGFPTIKIFEASPTPTAYSGARDAQAIVTAALTSVKKVVNRRLSGEDADVEPEEEDNEPVETDVVELTEENFEELVLNSEELWFVEFFAPWCGHCKNLAPHWEKAATKLKGKVNLGAVDATVHAALAKEYGVTGYPTIKVFTADGLVEDYEGGRTANTIVEYAEDLEIVVAVEQLAGQEALEACAAEQFCCIAFLPHILDTGASGRNKYIDSMHAVALANKKRPLRWMWTEGYQHQNLEEVLGIGSGYPAMVILNAKSKKFTTFKNSFSEEGIASFIKNLRKERWSPTPEFPTLVASELWDGKDGQLPPEDDYEIDDVEDKEEL